jgi:hypothetical protein
VRDVKKNPMTQSKLISLLALMTMNADYVRNVMLKDVGYLFQKEQIEVVLHLMNKKKNLIL